MAVRAAIPWCPGRRGAAAQRVGRRRREGPGARRSPAPTPHGRGHEPATHRHALCIRADPQYMKRGDGSGVDLSFDTAGIFFNPPAAVAGNEWPRGVHIRRERPGLRRPRPRTHRSGAAKRLGHPTNV